MKNYDLNFSDDENDSFFQQLNEIDNIHLRYVINQPDEECLPVDPRTGKVVSNIVLDCRAEPWQIEFFTNYPVQSDLQRHEHFACINTLTRMYSSNKNEHTKHDIHNMELYFALAKRRATEKEAFQRFVTNYCNLHLIDRFMKIDPVYGEYVDRKMKIDLDRLKLSFNNGSYQLHTAIPRNPYKTNDSNIILEFKKKIKELGEVSEFWWPPKIQISTLLKSEIDNIRRLNVAEKPYISKDSTIQEILSRQDKDG